MSEINITIEETDATEDSIPLPMKHKAKIIVWNDLSPDEVDQLMEFSNVPQMKEFLAEIFNLENYKTNLKQQIELDLYVHSVKFAQDKEFSPQQLSTFVSIIREVHKTCIETPFGNLDEVFQYLKDLLICHSVNRPPYSTELFTVDETHVISHYIMNTYIRHFKMYKYAFTPLVKLNLVIKYIGEPELLQTEEGEPTSEMTEAEEKLNDKSDLSITEEHEKVEEEENPSRVTLKNLIVEVFQEEIQNLMNIHMARTAVPEEPPKRKEESTKKGSKK